MMSSANDNGSITSQQRRWLKQIKAVSFDLDDTLWHCAPAIANAEHALFDWHRVFTPKITQAHTPESLQNYRHDVRRRHPELQGCVTSLRLAGLRALLLEFGYPEHLAEEAFEVFYRSRSEVQLYDGALDMLKKLGTEYRLAAITNGNADLQQIGIAQHFELIYAANLTLLQKPAPDMFLHCQAQMGISPDELLHIGDNPVTDITGGHNAGVQTLWFNPYNEDWPDTLMAPHFEVRQLSEIVNLLC